MSAGRGRQNLLISALTVTAAGTDALSYLGLGHVFPANMTGNTVLLGLGAATGDWPALSRSATALGAYVLAAVALGAALPENPRPRHVRAALLAEVWLLLAAAVWWHLLTGRPDGAPRYALIALAGTAMGMQSVIAARLRLPGVATTYITGTWTGLSMGIGELLRRRGGGRPPDGQTARGLVVALYPAAAFATATAYIAWHNVAALIPAMSVVLAWLICRGRLGRSAG
ncbi:YoaK family protein [Micromonospora sp. NPDC093277]|uniref:YoaK family protein n=1 Tax=Micromonospora sp. NPDC093277 TaxID=3364291 RepID=UPI00382CE6C0